MRSQAAWRAASVNRPAGQTASRSATCRNARVALVRPFSVLSANSLSFSCLAYAFMKNELADLSQLV